VKKEYYRYLLFSALLFGIVVSATYIMTNIPAKSFVFWDFRSSSPTAGTADSLLVIELNKEAFKSRLTDPKKTLHLADSALQLAKTIRYLPGMAEAYRVSGLGFAYLENNAFSVKNYLEALRCFKQLHDRKNMARTYNNIGALYKYNDPKKALSYFRKALNIAKQLNDEELIAGIYFNIALIYSKQSEYRKSLLNFDNSHKTFRKLNDTVSTVIYLQNTGRLYHRLHEIDSAKSRLFQAIQIAKSLKLYTSLSSCYLSLAYIYLEQNKLATAEECITAGLKYSQKIKNRMLDNDFIRVAFELELKRRNYKKALEHLSLVYRNDSLLLNENQSSNIDINSQHYLQQQKIQEKELVIAEQKYQQATLRWGITLGILILLLLAIVGLFLHFERENKRKRDKIMIQSEITSLKHKALQAMMNPHFVFNVMNAIQHFINQADIRKANQVLTDYAGLTRMHLELCMKSTITLRVELDYLGLYLSLEKIRFGERMKYEISIDEGIDCEEIIIPSMLIQPFLENASWHGIMPKEDGGTIKLIFNLDENDLLVSIIDDGIGISNSENSAKAGHVSRGMALIRERVSLLNILNKTEISIDQQQTGDHGTKVLIKIPT
jgi:tetratricopeptide (TPR) repeat protein